MVVSTIFGFVGGTFAAAGKGGLTGAGEDGGAPAATVSPGAAGCELIFADDSSLAEVSTSEPLRRLNYTLQRCIRVKDIELPDCRDHSLRKNTIFVYT